MSGGRKFWIGFGISAVLLALFFLTVDIGRLGEELASANYIFLVPAVALYLVSVGFRTLRWKWLLRHMKQIGWLRLYPVVVVGYMANNLLPMRLGELVRSYYVGEREGISKVSALVTIFVERLLDALTLLLFIAAIALFVPLAGLAEGFAERSGVPWPLLATALSVPFVAAFAVLLLLSLSPSRAKALAISVIRLLPHRFHARLQDMLETFLHGLVPLRSPGTIAVLFILTVPIWLFESGLFFVIGFSFDLHEMYDSPGEMAIALVLVTACTKPTLYSQIGGETMLTAVALEVSRDENLQDLVKRGNPRIFRQRLYEVLCAAAGGPCTLPEQPRFVIEMQLNSAERERVAQSLKTTLDTLGANPDLSWKLLQNSGLRSTS